MKTNIKLVRTKFAKKNRETILPSRSAQVINDILAIFLFAMASMLALALATHSANDNCWSKTIDTNLVYNKLGVVGAYLSDILYYVFGFSAWWLVIGIFYLGFGKISRHKITVGNWANIMGGISYLLLILASTVFEYVSFYHEATTLPDGFGGALGLFLFNNSYHLIGYIGIAVSSLLLLVICLSYSFKISWLVCAEKVGAVAEYIYVHLVTLVSRKDPEAGSVQTAVSETPEQTLPTFYAEGTFNKHRVSRQEQFADNDPDLDSSMLLAEGEPDESPEVASNLKRYMRPTAAQIDDEIVDNANFDAAPPPEVSLTRAKAATKTRSAASKNNSDLLSETSSNLLPLTNLLASPPRMLSETVSPETIDYVAGVIENTLAEFGVDISICKVETGPVITRYELVPPKGVRGEKIASLAKEIARALALSSIRIVETIPGKNTMGIEVPNFKRQIIYLKEIFDATAYANNSSLLTLALGKDIAGEVIVTDLAKMPHLLVAGTTGSGKSVAVNVMILSILFKASPDEVKFIMIDPKMVELSFYQDIPHLLAPVVTDMSQAANALKWAVGEMELRYKIMAKVGTKNILGFNQKVMSAIEEGNPLYNPYSVDPSDPQLLNKWPYIVIIIDELADLMMVAGKKIEQYIARIAQKARAVGIHLIVATQRPSVDVITGLIKANIPARISFQVSSKIDSRTILDQGGAEALLGHGDMLFLNPGSGFPRRIHGAFVNDDELHSVVEYLKGQGEPDYNEEILNGGSDVVIPGFEEDASSDSSSIEKDAVFDEAVNYILQTKRCSISALQTQFGIGYNKAARIMNHLEKIGMVRRDERGSFELLHHQPN